VERTLETRDSVRKLKKEAVTVVQDFRPKSELDELIEQDEAEQAPKVESVVEAKPEPKAEPKGAPTVVAELPKIPTLPPIDEMKPVVYVRPCGLEGAPVGSKVVILDSPGGEKIPTMTTPQGEHMLALNDLAFTLPVGAKVRKVVEGRFEAIQLNHQRPTPPLVTLTAREAMEGFVKHFHG